MHGGHAAGEGLPAERPAVHVTHEQAAATSGNGVKPVDACCPTHSRPVLRSNLPPAPDVPTPPFWGSRVVTDLPLDKVFGFLNERTLISTQWQFSKNKGPR